MQQTVPVRIVGGRWEATGPLPDGIKIQDTPDGGQIFVDGNGEPQPDCFGAFWEAVGPDSDDCLSCDMQAICRMAVVHFRLPEVLQQAGNGIERGVVDAIAPELGISVEAVRVLMEDYQAAQAQSASAKTKRPKRAPPGKRKTTEKGAPPENPSLASSVLLVADGANQSMVRGVCARVAEVWDMERRIWLRPWESKIKRDREREGNEWIARLVPGMVLRRHYAGQWWTLKIVRFGYQMEGIKYPTLREATAALIFQVAPRRPHPVRVLSPQGLVRWWKLPQLLCLKVEGHPLIEEQAAQEIERLHSSFWPSILRAKE